MTISVNDLPAARKVSGTAGIGSHFFCTVCNSYHLQNVWNTDFENWTRRDVNEMRANAIASRDAKTLAERKRILAQTGMRWSERWRLSYWDPTRMLVIDAMHCVLEGLVKYHCRYILCLDKEVAQKSDLHIAFSYDWPPYDPSKIPKDDLLSEREEVLEQVEKIQTRLTYALDLDDLDADAERMKSAILYNNLKPLKFVARSLRLQVTATGAQSKFTKKDFADALMAWVRVFDTGGKPSNAGTGNEVQIRLLQPLVDEDFIPKTIDMPQLKFVQRVIAKTATPSWINTVPKNYGEANAGVIKADEWRILATIYLPIALVLMWGDQAQGVDAERLLSVLTHSMALFQAVTIVCRYSSTQTHATAYREFIREWVDGLGTNHPHLLDHAA
ncbi:hypothetical protein B0H19DRAFT_953167 [Mycena capillaripes]|nr:hypothetical protein B0H19DRAFT_953167 [Mycena capillaripes]